MMAMPENYCLQWRDYQTHVTELFGQLLASDSLVDATLVAEGRMIGAHRVILSACSTFFQEMLTSAASTEPALMVLCGVSHEDVRSVVEFAYRGELSIPADRVESVLRLARDLRIAGLMEVGSQADEAIPTEAATVSEPEDAEEVETVPVEEPPVAKDNAEERARRPRRGPAKRNYNLSTLRTALEDLRGGRGLAETAAARRVPRSTLYFRARALGVPLASRAERPPQTLDAAVAAVLQGLSLAAAARRFDVPKTVLWRRVNREGGAGDGMAPRKAYAAEQREAAVKALEAGDNLTQVSERFGVPKSTLFREKARLVAAGRLPWSALRRRDGNADGHRQRRLAEAVDACRGRRMSQAAAAAAFRVPKTTIWRHIQLSSSQEIEESTQDDYSLAQAEGDATAGNQYTMVEVNSERADYTLDTARGETTEGHFSLETRADATERNFSLDTERGETSEQHFSLEAGRVETSVGHFSLDAGRVVASEGPFSLDTGRGDMTEGHYSLIPGEQGGASYLEGKPGETYALVEVEGECVEVDEQQQGFSLVEVDPVTYMHQSESSAVIVISSEGVVRT